MTDERCKQIMEQLGMPESRSLMQALFQVANETEQEVRKKLISDKYDKTKLKECCLTLKHLFKKYSVDSDDWNYCPVCGTMIYDIDYL